LTISFSIFSLYLYVFARVLFAILRKAKLLDDDDDEDFVSIDRKPTAPPLAIQPTIAWHRPTLLTGLAAPPTVNSKEKITQTTRMASVPPVTYENEFAVPNSPAPMSDVEQALDMTAQSSTTTAPIPFFVPQALIPALAPGPAVAAVPVPHTAVIPAKPPTPAVATAEIVQSLGLPMFLVGYKVDALEQLASQPSLLSTFVGVNGMYDQSRLTTFVQAMSGDAIPAQDSLQQQTTNSGYGSAGTYGKASESNAYGSTSSTGGSYGQASTYGSSYSSSSTRSNDRGSGPEANLHLSGYGPSTTQAEILSLFSPYVTVSEVVMKANFSFVNTRYVIARFLFCFSFFLLVSMLEANVPFFLFSLFYLLQ
jgi:hypothetical protein